MPRFGDGASRGNNSERNVKLAYVGGATAAGAGVAGAGLAVRNAGQQSAARNERELLRLRNDRTFARIAVDRHLAEAAGHRAAHRKGAAAADALAAEKKALDKPLRISANAAKRGMESGRKWAGRGKGIAIGAAAIPLTALATRNRVGRDWKANPRPVRESKGSLLAGRNKPPADRGGLSLKEHKAAATGDWSAFEAAQRRRNGL